MLPPRTAFGVVSLVALVGRILEGGAAEREAATTRTLEELGFLPPGRLTHPGG